MASEFREHLDPSGSVLELGSGPGFLAEHVLLECPGLSYTLLDVSPAMHALARDRLRPHPGARFVTADFKRDDWPTGLGKFSAVVTMQAVHELRHKRHAVSLHTAVRELLLPKGMYLVCDHTAGADSMADTELYMSAGEQLDALKAAGFVDTALVLEKGGLVLHCARAAA